MSVAWWSTLLNPRVSGGVYGLADSWGRGRHRVERSLPFAAHFSSQRLRPRHCPLAAVLLRRLSGPLEGMPVWVRIWFQESRQASHPTTPGAGRLYPQHRPYNAAGYSRVDRAHTII